MFLVFYDLLSCSSSLSTKNRITHQSNQVWFFSFWLFNQTIIIRWKLTSTWIWTHVHHLGDILLSLKRQLEVDNFLGLFSKTCQKHAFHPSFRIRGIPRTWGITSKGKFSIKSICLVYFNMKIPNEKIMLILFHKTLSSQTQIRRIPRIKMMNFQCMKQNICSTRG